MARFIPSTLGYLPLRKIALLVATAVGGSSMFSVAAQTPASAKEDNIVVTATAGPAESAWGPSPTIAAKRTATATKTDTPVEKTPQSISVVTNEEMQTHQFRSVKEALGYTPGVSVASRGASNTYDYVIVRGFAPVGLNQNNYLDGLKMKGDFYNDAVIDPYMLERVELMRGPTSVLYGTSSPGGIVNMVSKRPSKEPIHEIQFKLGNHNLYQTGFDFSDELDDDGVYSYRLTGIARSNNEQQDNAKQKRYAIAPAFTWQPNDRSFLTLLSYFQNEPETGYYGWLPKEGTVDPLPGGGRFPVSFSEAAANNTYSRNQKMVGYNAEHGLNDTFTLRQNVRFSQMKVSEKNAYGTGLCTTSWNCSSLPAGTIKENYLGRGTTNSVERLQNFSVDTQLQTKFTTDNIQHTLLAGVDYMRMRNDVHAVFGEAPPLDINNSSRDPVDFGDAVPYQLNKTNQTGIYLQDQAEWDKWVVTLGGRYDWLKQATTVREADDTVSRSDSQFSWRGGVNYLFDNGITPYISYSQSFEPNLFSLFGEPREAYKPSRGEQYEAGVKYTPKDYAVVVTGALFQLTKTNNLMADPTNPVNQVPAGELRVRGAELEAKAALSLNINMTASYTWTDAQYTRDTKLKGNAPAQVPKHMASLWGDYTFHSGALSGLTLGTGGRFIGSSFGDPANSFKVGSAAVMDAVVKYDLGRFGLNNSSIALNINNLLNREYVASCFEPYGCFWGAERQAVATATFRF